jgi:hypothetical protein
MALQGSKSKAATVDQIVDFVRRWSDKDTVGARAVQRVAAPIPMRVKLCRLVFHNWNSLRQRGFWLRFFENFSPPTFRPYSGVLVVRPRG